MTRVKYIGYFIIVILLFFPVIQKTFQLFRINPLNGYYQPIKEPIFTFKDFFAGVFQDPFNKYLEENIGFHPILVRLNNQISFTLFGMANASEVVVGKKNYLYEKNYIKAYLGLDFKGKEYWDDKTYKIKFIQDELKKVGVDLIVIFAPGKATFFPEYIPRHYHPEAKSISNREYLVKTFQNQHINFIDFDEYFVAMKDTVTYPLYPQCGIHWSSYGVAIAMDSIIRYIENLKQKNMVDFGWNVVEVSDSLRVPDYDLAEGMNLLFNIPYYPMAYPKLYFREDSLTYKPNVITIADSYYWNLHGSGITQRIYNSDKFWYYFNIAYGTGYPGGKDIKQINVLDEIERCDVVVILSTDANLYKFAFGFEEDVYNLIKQKQELAVNQELDEDRIRTIELDIRNDSTWFNEIKQKAIKKGITVEEMLKLDAKWVYMKENHNKK
ncbi:MAG: hypothetical protein NT175_08060 [Bacteroidetes bacterium]|nr:hypothetical protein [Bacteroidota bacterium]